MSDVWTVLVTGGLWLCIALGLAACYALIRHDKRGDDDSEWLEAWQRHPAHVARCSCGRYGLSGGVRVSGGTVHTGDGCYQVPEAP